MIENDFTDLVLDTRKKTGLTLFEFGSEIGVSWITVWRWENKKNYPKKNVMVMYAKNIKDLWC